LLAWTGLLGAVGLALGFYALALGLGMRWWRRRSRPLAFGTLTAAIVCLVALALATFGLTTASSSTGVVLDAGVVRSAPSPTATEAARLRAGATLKLGETQGAWQAVTVDDIDGWVPKSQVEAI
jgi:hypothetical protein